jgi:hypothetical protein
MAEAQAVRKKPLTDGQINSLFAYLWSGVDVADVRGGARGYGTMLLGPAGHLRQTAVAVRAAAGQVLDLLTKSLLIKPPMPASSGPLQVIDKATPIKTGLSLLGQKEQRAICPKGTSASLVFAYKKQGPSAAADGGSAGGYTAPPSPYAAAPAASGAYGYAPAGYSAAATLPGASNNAAGLITGFRRLQSTKLPTGAAASSSLLLPTSFSGLGRSKDGASVISGPVMLTDGAAAELRLAQGIPVRGVLYACDGTLFRVDTVPLPCNFLNRDSAAPPPAPAPRATLPALTNTISAALVNTSNIPHASSTVPVPAAALSAAAAGSVPLVLATAAAALAALLL